MTAVRDEEAVPSPSSSTIVSPDATTTSSVSRRFESVSKLKVARSVRFGLLSSNRRLTVRTAAGRSKHCVRFVAGTLEHGEVERGAVFKHRHRLSRSVYKEQRRKLCGVAVHRRVVVRLIEEDEGLGGAVAQVGSGEVESNLAPKDIRRVLPNIIRADVRKGHFTAHKDNAEVGAVLSGSSRRLQHAREGERVDTHRTHAAAREPTRRLHNREVENSGCAACGHDQQPGEDLVRKPLRPRSLAPGRGAHEPRLELRTASSRARSLSPATRSARFQMRTRSPSSSRQRLCRHSE